MFGECFVVLSTKEIFILRLWNTCKRGCVENAVSVGCFDCSFLKHENKKEIVIQLIFGVLDMA